ncbi:hypothetical protein YT1_3938 [Rhodococcus ruber]|nr:hypothetical protein YT1_3938 [Rhodococcus ruber]
MALSAAMVPVGSGASGVGEVCMGASVPRAGDTLTSETERDRHRRR